MPLSYKPFAEIELSDLQRLRSNGVPEGPRIDYKRDAYGPGDNKEFLKDFTSFANSEGGYLLIGVDERDGLPTEIVGLPNTVIDREIQRLENLLRDGVQPRVLGALLRPIKVDENNAAIGIQVPRSLNPPHRVIAQGTNRFFVRNSNGKHEANVEELRHLFGYAAQLLDEISTFVGRRRAQICSGNDFVPDMGNGRLIIHVVNASTFRDPGFVDMRKLFADPYRFGPANAHSLSPRITLEGVIVGPLHEGKFWDRTMVFRNGAIEAVYSDLHQKPREEFVIQGRHLMNCILHSVGSALREITAFGGTGPFAIDTAIHTVKGMGMAFYSNTFRGHPKFDRDLVEIPRLILLESAAENALPLAIRPILDAVWNAVGLPECEYFKEGNWQPPQ